MTVATMNYSDMTSYWPQNDWITQAEPDFGTQIDIFRGSAMDWAPTVSAALHEMETECVEEGWDGDGSVAIAPQTIQLAQQITGHLFNILPLGTPGPDVVPEGDGDIDLSWYRTEQRIFSLSISGQGVVNYAGRLGNKGEVHGWLPVDASNSSAFRESMVEISNYIKKLYE